MVRGSDDDGWGDVCDCDPAEPAIHPEATELCTNGVDDDCDGLPDGLDPTCL